MAVNVDTRISGMREQLEQLRAAQKRLSDLRPAMAAISEKIKVVIDRTFLTSSDPAGRPWKPLSAAYAARKAEQGYSPLPLVRRGARGLQGQIASSPTKQGFKFGVGPLTPYGAYHQFGTGNIPARPFLPIEGSPTAPRLMMTPTISAILREMGKRVRDWVWYGRR